MAAHCYVFLENPLSILVWSVPATNFAQNGKLVEGNNMMKILLAASAGGHLSQLLSIHDVWKGHDIVCLSTGEMVREKLQRLGETYIVPESNRQHLLKTAVVMYRCFHILRKEKPQIVISTGAAAGFWACFWGKLFGSKVIWLDSIANTQNLSMSGRMIRPFADLILSQWPDVAKKYPRVEYQGEVV